MQDRDPISLKIVFKRAWRTVREFVYVFLAVVAAAGILHLLKAI